MPSLLASVNVVKADPPSVTGPQLRAARALLGWSADELHQRTQVGLRTLRRAEQRSGPTGMLPANAKLVVAELEAAGVRFVFKDGAVGVLLTKFASPAGDDPARGAD